MKRVLILGAGRSSGALIDYLYTNGLNNGWTITVGDFDVALAKQRISNLPNATAISFNILNSEAASIEIASSDVVISMLPPALHLDVAMLCLSHGKHLLTASYVSPAMAKLHTDAKANGLIFLNECGLDPGIDHLSAMKIINGLRSEGAEIHTFKSWCGGLVAPESDNNPWGYKFSWNPRNVVLAGLGTSAYLEDGLRKFRPYNQLFLHPESIKIDGLGEFEGYPNRDSLSYKDSYGLKSIKTMIRGTLRKKGYCKAWGLLVSLGLTDDTYTINNLHHLSWKGFTNMFLPSGKGADIRTKMANYLNINANSEEMELLDWLGLFSENPVNLESATPAQALQALLEQKWKLEPDDKDLVVMQHRFDYTIGGKKNWLESSLYVVGDSVHTAMAKTVGLPLAMAAKLVLKGKITERGVIIPKSAEFYEPILKELKEEGIVFQEITG